MPTLTVVGPVGPTGPVAPCGMVKLNTAAAGLRLVLVTLTADPGKPVADVPTATVAVAPTDVKSVELLESGVAAPLNVPVTKYVDPS